MPGLRLRLLRSLRGVRGRRKGRHSKGQKQRHWAVSGIKTKADSCPHQPRLQGLKASHSLGPHGHTLPQLATNPENYLATTRPSLPLMKACTELLKHLPLTLQPCSTAQYPRFTVVGTVQQRASLVPPGCPRGRGRVTDTPRTGSLLEEARYQVGPQRSPGPDRERRCGQASQAGPSPEQRQLWCNAAPCRQPGNRPGCNCDEVSRCT